MREESNAAGKMLPRGVAWRRGVCIPRKLPFGQAVAGVACDGASPDSREPLPILAVLLPWLTKELSHDRPWQHDRANHGNRRNARWRFSRITLPANGSAAVR